jgi:3-dehydroquinate synthase
LNETNLDINNIQLAGSLQFDDQSIVVADGRLRQLHPDIFPVGTSGRILYLPAAERTKNLMSCRKIYDFLSANAVHRTDVVHVVGGGVVCDLASYAVATFKRGCRLILYPSTLLAMVDAAVGGKCGMNYRGIKNHIGTFYPAGKIIIYPKFLTTLKPQDIRQGKAEMLKSYLISDRLSQIDLKDTPPSSQILEYARFKMEICAADPHDLGLRRILNFGHSFGHAIEEMSSYRWKHGDSVVAGMHLALGLSHQLGLIDHKAYTHFALALEQCPLPPKLRYFATQPEQILPHAMQDKKNDGEGISLILPVGFRKVELKRVVMGEDDTIRLL